MSYIILVIISISLALVNAAFYVSDPNWWNGIAMLIFLGFGLAVLIVRRTTGGEGGLADLFFKKKFPAWVYLVVLLAIGAWFLWLMFIKYKYWW